MLYFPYANSSNSVLAAIKSAVSNPSVNQPNRQPGNEEEHEHEEFEYPQCAIEDDVQFVHGDTPYEHSGFSDTSTSLELYHIISIASATDKNLAI